ncbi:serine/threonine-protein phosphatase 4 regulatory subunit 3A isoform X1 [Gossypium australe]|uniref:Serine/threonine-protein phosphatase 4 regulatory subunit 3A isoform X1 n=1 Tax=Gossypium australe TaxID=47621 RepID=A0A5B6WFD5_9ROSI|nr:serine/threonine-protein phosphatase 4 regulatory subunit 3A isoform X1 [Gossypium australe]
MLRRVIVTRKAALLVLPYVSISVEKCFNDILWYTRPTPFSVSDRVKVYRLNEDGKWDDQGTGHVTVDYLEDNETLLVHRICPDDIYRKQEVFKRTHDALTYGETFHSMNSELRELPAVELSTLLIILKVLMNKSFSGLHSV